MTTHIGEDYSIVSVNGKEFETSLGLGLAISAHAPKETMTTEQEEISRCKEVIKYLDSVQVGIIHESENAEENERVEEIQNTINILKELINL